MFKAIGNWISGKKLLATEVKIPEVRPLPSVHVITSESKKDIVLLGLQDKQEIIERYHFSSRDNRSEPVTRITWSDETGEHTTIFPGKIPESFYLSLIGQQAEMTVSSRNEFYDNNLSPFAANEKWYANHVLAIKSGELKGQKFLGSEYMCL
jgi:hypothetical protein